MDRATYFPSLIESPLPEALRPETIKPEAWDQPVSIQLATLPDTPGVYLSGDVTIFSGLFEAVTITVDMFEQPIERQSEALVPNPASVEAFLVPLPDLDVPDPVELPTIRQPYPLDPNPEAQEAFQVVISELVTPAQDVLDLPVIRHPDPLDPNPEAQEAFLFVVDAVVVSDIRTLPVIRQPKPLDPNPQVQEQFLPVFPTLEVATVDKWDQPPTIPTSLLDFPQPWEDGLVILSTLFAAITVQDPLTASIRDFILSAAARDLTLTATDRDFTLTVEAP